MGDCGSRWDSAVSLQNYRGTNRLLASDKPPPKGDKAGAVAMRLSEEMAAALDGWDFIHGSHNCAMFAWF